uniref:T9SS type A sorting domain-containing protein n=1 Tax=candidate division WOR-3 bacterium TaxID=2052148 RepID=A0A7C4YEP2_UNCW3
MIFLFLLITQDIKKEVRIFVNEHKDVYVIHNLGVSIENYNGEFIETHLDNNMIQKLKERGYRVEIIDKKEDYPKVDYHNYASMVSKLDSIVSQYPAIAKKYIVGTTQQGRTIWALKISDNVELDEREPEVRFIGIIHGDEPIGCELTLYLADTLTKSYGIDSYLTSLVNDREIYLIPMFNVDGRENSSRFYANGVDPNRNFPVPDGSIGDDGTYTIFQETQNLMDWSDTMNFVLSVTYHSGAKIVNYQWDYTNAYPPLYSLIRKIAIGYAIRNDTIFYSPDPSWCADSGTVRGYLWYPAPGSLQDWSYHWTGCIDYTIELNSSKWPSSSKLPVIWENNKKSMLWLIEQAGKGIRGIVKDSITGNTIQAEYSIQGVNKTFRTGKNGDFSRPLLNGNWTLVFTKTGYFEKVVSNIPVSFDSTTFIEVLMKPISGMIEDTMHLSIIIEKYPFLKESFLYFIPESGNYSLKIFDLSGRIVKNIFDGKFINKGIYTCNIGDLKDGVYFIIINSERERITKKVIYLK